MMYEWVFVALFLRDSEDFSCYMRVNTPIISIG